MGCLVLQDGSVLRGRPFGAAGAAAAGEVGECGRAGPDRDQVRDGSGCRGAARARRASPAGEGPGTGTPPPPLGALPWDRSGG